MAILWLRSQMLNPNSFDAINAGNCLALIEKQKKALVSLGAHFNNLKRQRDRYARVIEEARAKYEDGRFNQGAARRSSNFTDGKPQVQIIDDGC
jgi:predicted  nucleic acid-binding Zn-ribbon protein